MERHGEARRLRHQIAKSNRPHTPRNAVPAGGEITPPVTSQSGSSARRAPAKMRSAGLWGVCLVFIFGAWAAVAGRAPAGVGATLPSPSDDRRVAPITTGGL